MEFYSDETIDPQLDPTLVLVVEPILENLHENGKLFNASTITLEVFHFLVQGGVYANTFLS